MANAIGTSFTSLLAINLFEQVLYSKLRLAAGVLFESTGFMADAAIREPSSLPVQK